MACEATCKKCISKGDSTVTIQNLFYNTDGYLPDDLVEIRVIVKNNSPFFHSDVCACLFDGDVIISTLYQIIPLAGLTYEFIFPTFTMGSTNRIMHISIISGAVFYDCTDYRNFTLKVVAPTGEGYRCDPVARDCVSDTTSNVPYDTCLERCRGGAGITDKVVCTGNDMNVMGICVPKPVVLGIFALGAIYIFKSS